MEEAVDRLLDARDRGERVAIVGDYDVDGITATAQLLAVFKKCGLESAAPAAAPAARGLRLPDRPRASGRGRWAAV